MLAYSFAIAQSPDLWLGFSVTPNRGSLSLRQVFFRQKVATGSLLSSCCSLFLIPSILLLPKARIWQKEGGLQFTDTIHGSHPPGASGEGGQP